ncbi:MAG: FGGY-family carbohydrate kinase [Caldicoprobacterales bacterium]|jgi:xylulokinase
MKHILTFDVGTTAIKAVLFNEHFEILDSYHSEYNLVTPKPDWVELNPDIYWDKFKDAVRSILTKATDPRNIKVITITTQGETLIPVDANGIPLSNAIVWQDNRARHEAELLSKALKDDEYYRATGMPDLTPATPIAKILWIKNNKPDLYERACKFLLVEDYLLFKLTGRFVSEQSLLSSTGYFDINTGAYWDKILNAAGISVEKLPQIQPCATVVGNVTKEAAAETGLDSQTVISTGAMDQISSAVGAGNVVPGVITETTGTALAIGATVDKPNYNNPEKVIIHRHFNGKYIYLPYCQTSGIVLKWFKDEFLESLVEKSRQENVSVYTLVDQLAENVEAGAGGLIMLPNFAGKLSPDYNPDAKGVLYGLGLDTRKEHIIRAIMEGVAYMLKENIELLSRLGIDVKEVRSLGGGSKSTLWLQIKADVLNKAVIGMDISETTSLGAAIMGAISIGLYDTHEEIYEKCISIKERLEPNTHHVKIYEQGYRQYLKIYNRLKDI